MELTTELVGKVQRNNSVWLRSWGCEIREFDTFVQARNDFLPDYDALFDLKPTFNLETVRRVISFESRKSLPTVFVDSDAAFEPLVGQLGELGFRPYLLSETYVGESSAVPSSSIDRRVQLVRSSRESIELWSDLYSAVFGHNGELRTFDLMRWSRCIKLEPSVLFFVIRTAGATIGTIQLCKSAGIAGIYSFGILPAFRGRALALPVVAEVLNFVRREGIRFVYYDRLRPLRSQKLVYPRTVRNFTRRNWRLLRSATGFRKLTDRGNLPGGGSVTGTQLCLT